MSFEYSSLVTAEDLEAARIGALVYPRACLMPGLVSYHELQTIDGGQETAQKVIDGLFFSARENVGRHDGKLSLYRKFVGLSAYLLPPIDPENGEEDLIGLRINVIDMFHPLKRSSDGPTEYRIAEYLYRPTNHNGSGIIPKITIKRGVEEYSVLDDGATMPYRNMKLSLFIAPLAVVSQINS